MNQDSRIYFRLVVLVALCLLATARAAIAAEKQKVESLVFAITGHKREFSSIGRGGKKRAFSRLQESARISNQ
jgi:hypothetical protein